MKTFAFVISGLLLAAPAFAQTTGNMAGNGPVLSGGSHDLPEGPSTSGTNENGERRICRRIEATESRMGSRRVCLTASEWRDHNRRN